MKKFLVLYHAPQEAEAQIRDTTPEQQAKGMQLWMDWQQRCGDKLVDMGLPLINGQQLNHDGTVTNSDKDVRGYSILQAADMEEAKGLMQGHPHIGGWNKDATLELHEMMPMPGM